MSGFERGPPKASSLSGQVSGNTTVDLNKIIQAQHAANRLGGGSNHNLNSIVEKQML
jgi:hypothetical protein